LKDFLSSNHFMFAERWWWCFLLFSFMVFPSFPGGRKGLCRHFTEYNIHREPTCHMLISKIVACRDNGI
jgi:hypothetical protein